MGIEVTPVSPPALCGLKVPSEVSTAVRALTSIPVNRTATVNAAPSFFLLFNPGVNADNPLASDIVQDFTMVTHAIVIESDDLLTGKIRALSTVG